MENDFKKWVDQIIEPIGIKIDGSNPWDIRIINPKFYNRVKAQGSLGLGESYMDGWWECDRLDDFFYRILSNGIYEKIGLSLPILFDIIRARLFNLQAIRRAFQVGEKHYDTGNDLFKAMLGKTMAYSCGYWKSAKSLDKAQEAKLDLICKKLNLKKGQRILDIGCGWGSFAFHAAKNYGVKVVGITVSKEQLKLAQEICKGLPVEIRLQDYRQLNEKFDHIVSIGMFEHVGFKNYKTFFNVAKNCLKENGLFLLHTIGSLKTKENVEPWTNKYIFPNGMLPSLKTISLHIEGSFIIEDVHNFGADYDKTLMAWYKNFETAWPELKNKYSPKFYRMWKYYLLSCAGAFRARDIQLWQIVLSPHGVKGGYKSIR
ncbi:MAG: cyclopropane fatty acyl phospholipid synthase [Candidatus Staskawiczbacteria bacterium]|nr:cyclopropane fatty acyl phospholipid synthase [Candidatus Staskawiczbacteria bacterium]